MNRDPSQLHSRYDGSKSQSQIVGIEFIDIFVAEKGGSRTLRGPYDPQTGFEDQRHHRAPSFSIKKISYLRLSNPLICNNSRSNLRGAEGGGDICLLRIDVTPMHLR